MNDFTEHQDRHDPRHEEATDAELVGIYRHHQDLDAIAVLIRRHEAGLRSMARRVLHHDEDAADVVQSTWVSGTRAAAERAKAELAARHVDDAEPEQRTTATEWLAAHRAETADDETHREVTEDDVTDRPNDLHKHEHEEVERANEDHDDEDHEVEARGPDIREVAASEPSPVAEDHVRVPSADETSAAVEKANRALAEIRAREDADAREEAEHRAEQLTHWQARDEEVETPDHSNEPFDDTDADFADDLGEVDA